MAVGAIFRALGVGGKVPENKFEAFPLRVPETKFAGCQRQNLQLDKVE